MGVLSIIAAPLRIVHSVARKKLPEWHRQQGAGQA